MKKIVFFLLVLLCVATGAGHCDSTEETCEDTSDKLDKSDLKAVYCDPDDPNIIYVKPKKSLKYDDKDNKTYPNPNPDFNSALNNPSHNQDPEMKEILEKFDAEPGIQEIQEAAIRYAEVHKGKIDEWRKCAKRKALLPTLSVNTGRCLTDYYHWDAGTNPDTLQKGKDPTDWSVTASWNLGELIWNDDQTSIDARSRLMVQLRDDIINEVTRLYFERRRLQIELLTNPPKNLQTKLEKELRLQEFTAGIDALTGGHLSKKAGQVNS